MNNIITKYFNMMALIDTIIFLYVPVRNKIKSFCLLLYMNYIIYYKYIHVYSNTYIR